MVPSEQYGDRYACVKVEVSQEKPVRYELGMVGNEDLDEELGEDEYFGFGVDAGMGCVADIQTQAAFKAYWAKRLEEDPDIDPTTTCSAIFWKKTPKPTPNIRGLRRLAQLDSAGHGLQPAHLCLRLGMVTILSTSGMTPRAKSAPCMCGSLTLKPVIESRIKNVTEQRRTL